MDLPIPSIHKLPQEIIRLIAAGEVIERPASVVKELVENALDAGSRHIEVRLVNGGLTSISVRDDGHGIPVDQMPLLLERHITSKIQLESDLGAISTLGFRGEALFSIAAASDLVLSTRYRDEPAGTRLTWQETRKTIETIAWPGGTQVESIRLFHSTPARKKFLRSSSAEFARAAEVVSAYALAWPHVGFRLLHDGREIFSSPGTGKLEDAILAVWGSDVARKMVPVGLSIDDIHVAGAIGSLEITRSRRTDQIVFLNGRFIKDPSISAALERPYMPLLPQGRHPLAVLMIECDPSDVDVNVHPNKREVRLAEPRAITSAVYHAVDTTLRSASPFTEPWRFDSKSATGREITIDPTTGEVMRGVIKEDEVAWALRMPKSRHTPDWPPVDERSTHPTEAPGQRVLSDEARSPDETEGESPLTSGGNAIQFLDTYIIYNEGPAVYLIDQHNLHERILFEELCGSEKKSGATSQTLLFPLQVRLSPALASLVAEHRKELEEMGFDIEEFSEDVGGQSFVLRAIPQTLKDPNPAAAFADIIERASEEGDLTAPGGFRRAFAASLACKSAIKAGQRLTDEEMRFLVSHIEDITYLTCPHGRPTVIRLDQDWFRKVFKRG